MWNHNEIMKLHFNTSNTCINCTITRTTDTQWRHKSKISEKLGRCGRQNMLPPYLKIWDWDWIFGRAVKAISSLGVRSPCIQIKNASSKNVFTPFWCGTSISRHSKGQSHYSFRLSQEKSSPKVASRLGLTTQIVPKESPRNKFTMYHIADSLKYCNVEFL